MSLQNKLDVHIKLGNGLRKADVSAVRLINGTYYGKATLGKQSLKLCSLDNNEDRQNEHSYAKMV